VTDISSKTPDEKMNLITLSFSKSLEKAFQEEYFRKSIRHVRICVLLGLFLYGSFGFLDLWIVPAEKTKVWFIRYAIFSPYALSLFLFSFSKWFKRYMQPLLAFMIILAGLGITTMMIIAPFPGNNLYYGGLILVFFYCYTFVKLRFIWAAFAGWTVLAGYEIGAICLNQTALPILINHNFFFITANIIGMFACYSMEHYTRNDFVQRNLLNVERNKVQQVNRELEHKVKERTSQLRKTNEELRGEIIERKGVERRLSESEERYRTIVETIEEGYYEVDVNGHVIYLNNSMCKIFDHPQEECLGRHLKTFTDEKNAQKGFQAFHQVYHNGVPLKDFKWKIFRKNGKARHLDASVSLMRDSEGNRVGFRGIMKDVTEQMRAQEELARSKEEAETANLAKSEFLANMSHELRTPLNHILGFTELVLDRAIGELNQAQEEYLTDVYNSSRHLLALINDILDLAKVEAGKLEFTPSSIKIRDVLENSLVMIKEKALKRGIKVTTDLDNIPQSIQADERKLKQILYNLLANAVKFTPTSGSIVLAAKRLTDRDKLPKDMSHSSTSYLQISVEDSGIGLNKQDLERIFESFEQVESSASRQFQGTGLGLSLTKSLVELHNGKIWAESVGEGQGATFSFCIPV